jgi:multiple sugar transport system substrate-binding protein
MKKFVLSLFVAVILIALVGCAPPQPTLVEEPVQPEQPIEEVREPPTEEPPVDEPPAEELPAEEPPVLGPVTIQFSGWTYDTAKVRDNIARFESWVETQAVPPVDVTVEWTDSGYGGFDAFVTTVFAGGDTRDVLYSSDHWLAKWAEAGWVVPLEDYWPDVKNYLPNIEQYSIDAMTYNGKLYGLPYYTDVMYFVYNKHMLEEAGITAPPTSWAEVTEQSLILKEKGISDIPFLVGLAPGAWFDEAFYALVYSEGGVVFDENLDPVFETTQGPVFDMLEWLAKSLNEDQIIPRKVLEMTAPEVQEVFKQGDAAFVIVPGYMMREFNTPGISKIAGNAAVSMMPGASHQTGGFTRMYLLGSGAIEDEVKLQAALHLIEYLGGETTVDGVTEYHVARRWAVENSLGFSIKSLWEDPAVLRSLEAIADTTVMRKQKEIALPKQGMSAPWFGEWIAFVRAEVPKTLLRQQDTSTTLENIKQQWLALKAE